MTIMKLEAVLADLRLKLRNTINLETRKSLSNQIKVVKAKIDNIKGGNII